MRFTTLIEPAALAANLRDPDWVTVDCRYALDDPSWGERAWAEGHVPGAAYAHLQRDLSGTTTGRSGRHPLPDPSEAARIFGRWGITDGVQVVAYDQDAGAYASRLWWLLRWLGHLHVAVLDGGLARWTAEGCLIDARRPARPPRVFHAAPKSEMLAGAADVADALADASVRLIDARSPERYRGETEPIDRVPGHIPGAVNHFYRRNVDERGRFLPVDEIRRIWNETASGVASSRLICYCGSGVTACQNLLALEHAGLAGARLYAGSWSEWSSDPARPVSRTGS